MNELLKQMPELLQTKCEKLQAEINEVVEKAEKVQSIHISWPIRLGYESSVPRDILTEFERAQSICFVIRYENLPVVENLHIREHDGSYYLNNIGFIKYVLNEYRTIIQNQRDSVYYKRIHKFCRKKMVNRDKTKDLVITVYQETDEDITETFTAYLDEQCKAIRVIIDNCDYGYIYNGILQHSDHNFTKRFLEEYSSGNINYTFIKHAQLLVYIKERLYWHYKLLNTLTFPKIGPL